MELEKTIKALRAEERRFALRNDPTLRRIDFLSTDLKIIAIISCLAILLTLATATESSGGSITLLFFLIAVAITLDNGLFRPVFESRLIPVVDRLRHQSHAVALVALDNFPDHFLLIVLKRRSMISGEFEVVTALRSPANVIGVLTTSYPDRLIFASAETLAAKGANDFHETDITRVADNLWLLVGLPDRPDRTAVTSVFTSLGRAEVNLLRSADAHRTPDTWRTSP